MLSYEETLIVSMPAHMCSVVLTLFVTLRIIAHQASMIMEFSRQGYLSAFPFSAACSSECSLIIFV